MLTFLAMGAALVLKLLALEPSLAVCRKKGARRLRSWVFAFSRSEFS
jgi:hypothetical protein